MSEILIFIAIVLALSMALSKDPFAPCAYLFLHLCDEHDKPLHNECIAHPARFYGLLLASESRL